LWTEADLFQNKHSLEWDMTDSALPQLSAKSNFSVGQVFNRTSAIFSRNLLPFCLINFVCGLPNALIYAPRLGVVPASSASVGLMLVLGGLGAMILGTISQAVVLYAAFDDMRGRAINLGESFRIGLRRFFPILGIAICVVLLAMLAAVAFIFPALIVVTMLYVSVPACVVERLGPIKSMGRSARLTKGHRWKVFGLWFATLLVGAIFKAMLQKVGATIGGARLEIVFLLLWSAVYGAFSGVLAIVTYHDLRVAKEGVDTDQIASVFD
jgi:hypothetical protein